MNISQSPKDPFAAFNELYDQPGKLATPVLMADVVPGASKVLERFAELAALPMHERHHSEYGAITYKGIPNISYTESGWLTFITRASRNYPDERMNYLAIIANLGLRNSLGGMGLSIAEWPVHSVDSTPDINRPRLELTFGLPGFRMPQREIPPGPNAKCEELARRMRSVAEARDRHLMPRIVLEPQGGSFGSGQTGMEPLKPFSDVTNQLLYRSEALAQLMIQQARTLPEELPLPSIPTV